MGSYNKGILGPFKGKVGTVVGYTWRGKDLMRSLPKASTSAPTLEQTIQREKFKTVIGFLTPIKGVVAKYFGKDQKSKSRFNLATSYHLREALEPGMGNSFQIDYTKVLISRGDLRGIDNLQVAPGNPGELTLSWADNSTQSTASPTDKLVVVAFVEVMNEFIIFNPATERDQLQVSLSFPPYMGGADAYVWATFVTEDGKIASISSYGGAETIPV